MLRAWEASWLSGCTSGIREGPEFKSPGPMFNHGRGCVCLQPRPWGRGGSDRRLLTLLAWLQRETRRNHRAPGQGAQVWKALEGKLQDTWKRAWEPDLASPWWKEWTELDVWGGNPLCPCIAWMCHRWLSDSCVFSPRLGNVWLRWACLSWTVGTR